MTMHKLSFRAALLAVIATIGCGATTPASAKDVVIHAGRFLDGTLARPRAKVSILVHDDRIVSVTDGYTAPDGAQVVDLSDETVLPGLIDMHSHLGYIVEDDEDELHFSRGQAAEINVIRNAYHDLSTGFTSLRDVGTNGVDFKPIMLAIAKGRLVGSRIWPSLEPLGPAGGHSDPWNDQEVVPAELREQSIIRGPIDAVEKVRDHVRRGAKIIKIMPSGGVSSMNDNPHAQLMTYDEIKAVVDTAHTLGVKVAAHAHGLEAIRSCVRAGCDSIEHGTYGDEAVFKEMKAKGIYLDPTLTVAAWKYEMGKAHPEFFDPRVLAKGMKSWPVAIAAATRAHAVGVKIVMGTDESALGKGIPKAMGITRLVEAGLTPQEAIVAATGNAADLMGSPDIGVLAAGRLADIIAVKGDPIADTTVLLNVDFVMKDGIVYKRDGHMVAEMH
jgi:imidazolonepropionase-like amidohydrolase